MLSIAVSPDAVSARCALLRVVAFFSAVLAVVAVLAGCGGPSKRCCGGVVQGLAIVQGVHANAPTTSDLSDMLTAAVDRQANVSVVEADGAPYLVATAKLTSQANNSTAREQEKSRLLAQLGQAVAAATPRTAQDDLLDAVALAARYLGSSGDRTMVVADSGLQTTGVLRFQQPGMLDAAPGDISALLARLHALPDLRGISVVLVGIGDVASPQKSLSQPERSNLVAIWESVLRRAGARVSVSSTPRQGAAPAGAPTVSVVPVSPVVLTLPKAPPVGSKTPVTPPAPTPLPAAEFFAPDSAALLDAAAATAALKPFADAAITRHLHIDLLGTSARWGSRQGQITLSGRRAAAIAAILIHLGVPSTQVTSRGVGSYWPGYRSDLDDAGNLLPGPAALNRTVQISFASAPALSR